MARLLVISSAPATLVNGKPFLDIKFVEGMRFYTDLWDGPVSCLLKQRDNTFPFGQSYEQDQIPFDLTLLPANKTIGAEEINGSDIILCGGDNHEYLHLVDICCEVQKNTGLYYRVHPRDAAADHIP